jgi:hypothetical protein
MSLLIFIEKKQEARAVEEKFEKANDNNTCDEQRAHKTQRMMSRKILFFIRIMLEKKTLGGKR